MATEVSATFEYLGKSPTPATATILARDPRERTMRALRALGSCWGLAIVALFIPVLHFILVPSLLVAGPLIARSLNSERVTVISARGACPACAHEQSVTLGRGARPRIDFRCEKCGRQLALALPSQLVESAGA